MGYCQSIFKNISPFVYPSYQSDFLDVSIRSKIGRTQEAGLVLLCADLAPRDELPYGLAAELRQGDVGT